jgi:hypothetical protein
MPGKIFISYRRDDSAAQVHGIAQYLDRAIGRHQIFVDVDMIPGTNFHRELEKRLGECAVLLALIGPGWLDATDDQNRRRLDDPDDWVRLEISHALKRGITVIPVLLGGAKLPKREALPEDIQGLLDHQAARVGTETFRNDLAGLASDIATLRRGPRRWWIAAAAAAALLIVAGASYGAWVSGWFGPRASPSATAPPNPGAPTAAPSESAADSRPVSVADVLAHCIKDQRHPDGADSLQIW